MLQHEYISSPPPLPPTEQAGRQHVAAAGNPSPWAAGILDLAAGLQRLDTRLSGIETLLSGAGGPGALVKADAPGLAWSAELLGGGGVEQLVVGGIDPWGNRSCGDLSIAEGEWVLVKQEDAT